MFFVSAVWKGELVYLTSQTNLNWRTMLHLNRDPVLMSGRAAQHIAELAAKDEQLFRVTVEVAA